MNIRQLCAQFAKKRNRIKMHSIACCDIWHVDTSAYVYDKTYNQWKFGGDTTIRQKCMKIPKKRNKIKRHKTCSYVWNVDISKCVYWLDTHSVKVWWGYVLPNANTAHFCDVFFRHRAVLPSCLENRSRKSKIRPS